MVVTERVVSEENENEQIYTKRSYQILVQHLCQAAANECVLDIPGSIGTKKNNVCRITDPETRSGHSNLSESRLAA